MKRIALLICLISAPSIAQQVDAAKLVAALQQQRNEALDKAAVAEAKAAALLAELERLKAEQDKK
jgi:uncharacterized small protein (DUF1192 family)